MVDTLDVIETLYGLKDQEQLEDWFSKTRRIYLGTYKRYDELGDINSQSLSDWYSIPFPEEFHWSVCSSAGTYKTVFLLRLMTYFAKSNRYDLCCIEGKDNDSLLSRNMGKGSRLMFKEEPVKLNTYGICPSYIWENKHDQTLQAQLKKYKIKGKFTLDISSVRTPQEWQTLLGLTTAGVDVVKKYIDRMKKINLEKLRKQIVRDPQAHLSTKNSLNLRLGRIIIDKIFNAKNYPLLNIGEYWKKKIIPIILLMRRDREYQRLLIQKLLENEWYYSEQHFSKKINIYDDCQLYLDNIRDNCAVSKVLETINFGRSFGFNSIFAVQNPNEFSDEIFDACTDHFIGYLKNPQDIDIFPSDVIEMIRQNWDFYDDENKPVKHVAYLHIPMNIKKSVRFFPAGPICGYYW